MLVQVLKSVHCDIKSCMDGYSTIWLQMTSPVQESRDLCFEVYGRRQKHAVQLYVISSNQKPENKYRMSQNLMCDVCQDHGC